MPRKKTDKPVGRPPTFNATEYFRISIEDVNRMVKVLEAGESKAEFMRSAVLREVERRERKGSKR